MNGGGMSKALETVEIGDIVAPNGRMKISNQGIMLGGPNIAGREYNSAQISAGLHEPNSLNIVGMSSSMIANDRRVDIWSEGGLHLRGPRTDSDDRGMINIHQSNPGSMIEKRQGTSKGDRYGMGQYSGGSTRLYAAKDWGPSSVNLSFAKEDGGFDDVLKVQNTNNGGQVIVNGYDGIKAADNLDWLRIHGTAANGTALHHGVSVNGNGGLSVGEWKKVPTGEIHATNKLCIDNLCVTKENLQRMIDRTTQETT